MRAQVNGRPDAVHPQRARRLVRRGALAVAPRVDGRAVKIYGRGAVLAPSVRLTLTYFTLALCTPETAFTSQKFHHGAAAAFVEETGSDDDVAASPASWRPPSAASIVRVFHTKHRVLIFDYKNVPQLIRRRVLVVSRSSRHIDAHLIPPSPLLKDGDGEQA